MPRDLPLGPRRNWKPDPNAREVCEGCQNEVTAVTVKAFKVNPDAKDGDMTAWKFMCRRCREKAA